MNRKKRKLRRQRRREQTRITKSSLPTEGNPIDYLIWARDWLSRQNSPAVILYYRVSTDKQNRNYNYAWQENCLRRFCRTHEIDVVDERYEWCNGHGTDGASRPELAQAIDLATAHRVPILAASTDRYLRPLDFDKFNQSAQPTVDDFEALAAFAAPATLLTYLAPDTDWTQVKSLQRSESAKVSKGRRRPKPMSRADRRDTLFDEVQLLSRCNLSSREIAAELEARGRPYVSHKSIWKWLNGDG